MSEFALEIKHLCKNFGATQIIRDLNLSVLHGERIAIIGPNGAGKSTLFNLISGQFAPSSGEILLNSMPIQGKSPYEINRLGLARSFQISNLFQNLTVFENLSCSVLWSLGKGYLNFKLLSAMKDVNDRSNELMKDLNYGKDYKYAHDFKNHYVKQEYKPSSKTYYIPTEMGHEKKIKEWLDQLKSQQT